MGRKSQLVFLLLILAQGAHSAEEYSTALYEVFGPARWVSSLLSDDLALGFFVFNAALVAFGLWCWAVPVRLSWRAAGGVAWFWTVLELGNGIGHLALALSQGGYFPGVATAPLLVLLAAWLAVLQLR
ncbi:MAG: HXXEE domain-containing protein [Acidobacteria bacterium]|nr:HXXEE domain-containing protein [Acidobacteriota bacterium]